jgi:antitoxin HicB
MRTLTFSAQLLPDSGGYVVSFRDVPEALTQGDTLEEAESMPADALLTCMEFYFEDGRPLPTPSAALPGERLISCTVGDGSTFSPDNS